MTRRLVAPRLIGLGFALGSWSLPVGAATDPFAAYIDHVPTLLKTISSVDSGAGAAAVTVKELTFASRDAANTVYGILSQPQAAGKYPGILVLHGGGGNAQSVAGIAKSYAAQGYVTLAVDLPHICIPSCSTYSTGPWRDRPVGEAPRLEVQPGPERSVLVDAELAGVEGFNFLRAQSNVDPEHMGIFGFSWGGYSTTMLSGLLGDKVKAPTRYSAADFTTRARSGKTCWARFRTPIARRGRRTSMQGEERRTSKLRTSWRAKATINSFGRKR